MTDRQTDILSALYGLYPEAMVLMRPDTAHMVVEDHRVASLQTLPGVDIRTEEADGSVLLEINIAEGVRVQNPIHACVGLMAMEGSQQVRLRIRLERGASAELLAHCMFPNAERIRHAMEAEVDIGEGAELRHTEGHYHGPSGGIEVTPRAEVRIHPGGRYFADFSLTFGRVGKLRLDYRVQAHANAVAEIGARVFGHATDEIVIRDELVLAGEHARGLIKTRVAVEDEATSEVIGITRGNAEGARGHMDCMELVRDRAAARAEPIVHVAHPLAKITHEAAVGTVDQKQLETLMAHGLSPEEAVDVIIMGILQ